MIKHAKQELATLQKATKTNKKKNLTKKDNKQIARTRRHRGYHWEDTLVKRFNSLDNWKAFRLGSPSVALPDILVISTQESTIITIEAKSGTTNSLPVPYDQIKRCLRWTNTFELYETRKVILAFKFLSKKRIGRGVYESRKLREFYKIWDAQRDIIDCVCTYEGHTYGLVEGKQVELELEDYKPPFF